MDAFDKGLRCQDVHSGLRNVDPNSPLLAPLADTRVVGMAATIAGLIRGRDVITDAQALKGCAAASRLGSSSREGASGGGRVPYLDGHVRVYSGGRQLPKTHIARMRIAGPATEETWVGDSEGDPVMVITAAPSQSLAAELHRLLPGLRALVGANRKCTVVFDRGGYSPQVLTEIIAAGFDLMNCVSA